MYLDTTIKAWVVSNTLASHPLLFYNNASNPSSSYLSVCVGRKRRLALLTLYAQYSPESLFFARCFLIARYFLCLRWMFLSYEIEVWNMLQPRLLRPSRWEMQSWNSNLSHPSRIIFMINWIDEYSIIALFIHIYTVYPNGPKYTRVYLDSHVVLH